jgi:hypothetical protein
MTREEVIAVCAIVGALLGVFNLIRSYLNDSERLSVAVWSGDDDKYPSVEVVNRSPFPVTIVELARVSTEGQVGKVILDYKYPQELPQRIEARDALVFHVDLRETLTQQLSKILYTYARTALGSTFTTESVLERWWRRLREAVKR